MPEAPRPPRGFVGRTCPGAPTITVVTPCLDRVDTIEHTICSVLDQGHPGLEYVVVDGGSTDGTVDIIRRYERFLAGWTSEPDAGQYAAVAKGFARTRGEVMAWLSADDVYLPGALAVVSDVFSAFPEVAWLTSAFPTLLNEQGQVVDCRFQGGVSAAAILAGDHIPGPGARSIQQESTFWRRSLWEAQGGFDSRWGLAGDFALWVRFLRAAPLHAVASPLGAFRLRAGQRSERLDDYARECAALLEEESSRSARLAAPGLTRRALRRLVEYRTLSGLPRPLTQAAASMGLLRQAPGISWSVERRCWEQRVWWTA